MNEQLERHEQLLQEQHEQLEQHQAPVQMEPQQQEQQQEQNQVMQNAQQLEDEIPLRVEELNDAYAAVHGNTRMSKKERKKRLERYDEKKAVSDNMKAQIETYNRMTQERNAALPEGMQEQYAGKTVQRMAMCWLRPVLTENDKELNAARLSGLCSDNNQESFAAAESVFSEFLAFDVTTLTYENDEVLAENYSMKIDMINKGMEINNLVTRFEEKGMQIPLERKIELMAKADFCEDLATHVSHKADIVANKYYALLKKDDIKKFSFDELAERYGDAGANGNAELSQYFNNLMNMSNTRFDRKVPPLERLEKFRQSRRSRLQG